MSQQCSAEEETSIECVRKGLHEWSLDHYSEAACFFREALKHFQGFIPAMKALKLILMLHPSARIQSDPTLEDLKWWSSNNRWPGLWAHGPPPNFYYGTPCIPNSTNTKQLLLDADLNSRPENLIRQAVAAGDVDGLCCLGIFLGDTPAAQQAYCTAMAKGHPFAMLKMANYWMKLKVSQEEVEPLYLSAGKAGFSNAYVIYASHLREGKQIPQDLQKGVQLLRQAVSMGDTVAMLHLASWVSQGIGVSRSALEALELYRRAQRDTQSMKTRKIATRNIAQLERLCCVILLLLGRNPRIAIASPLVMLPDFFLLDAAKLLKKQP